jgi:hypothetical protein
MLIRIHGCSLPCLSHYAPWPTCLSESLPSARHAYQIMCLHCGLHAYQLSEYMPAAYKAYQLMCLYRGLHAYQSLCLQLGNCTAHACRCACFSDSVPACHLASSWAFLLDCMLAAGRTIVIIYCMLLAGPTVLIRFYASSRSCQLESELTTKPAHRKIQ